MVAVPLVIVSIARRWGLVISSVIAKKEASKEVPNSSEIES